MKKEYKEYADLKRQIKELTQQAKEMETRLYVDLASMDGEKLTTPHATYSIMYRNKWKYSEELSAKELQIKTKLKTMKLEEENNGKAEKLSAGGYLRCQLIK